MEKPPIRRLNLYMTGVSMHGANLTLIKYEYTQLMQYVEYLETVKTTQSTESAIPDVVQQRELLLAFSEYVNKKNDHFININETEVDDFIKQ